jgi:DNA-binding NtrC family response regulator
VEQISILETDRNISAEILLKYLPREENLIPALYKNKNEEGVSERELLYKVLFEMRRDVTELKKLVNGIISEEDFDAEALRAQSSIVDNQETITEKEHDEKTTALLIKPTTDPTKDLVYSNVEDISHETESEESLSLEEKEKELIMKALKKNNNKRKYAAKDLGISERTLYRKIKQFEIEE